MDLTTLGNAGLQRAVRRNLVSFPAQAPVYPAQSRPDLQWRIAVLYFLRGWSFRRIAGRYRLTHERVGQIARDWRKATVAAGYIQEIPMDGLPVTSTVWNENGPPEFNIVIQGIVAFIRGNAKA